MTLILSLSIIAFLTAALSGFSGLGGGTVLMAAMLAIGLPPLEAVPLFAAVQLVSNSSRTVAYVRHVRWPAIGWFTLAAIPATLAVAPFVSGFNPDAIRLLLAFLVLGSLLPGRLSGAKLGWRPASLLAGVLNGAVGMFVGATGLFTGRLFLRADWSKEATIATLAMTQVIGHGLRVISFAVIGFSVFARVDLLVPMCLGVIAGTWLGRRLNRRLRAEQFRLLFVSLLILLSCKLIFDAWMGL